MKDLINCYKYQAMRAIGAILAELLDARMWGVNGIVVPLPTIRRHIRERGFDHTTVVAKKLALPCERLLGRRNNSVQVGATAEVRRQQAQEAYEIKRVPQKGREYWLLDDVWTTGSSMLAARKCLLEAGADKVSIVVISKTRDN